MKLLVSSYARQYDTKTLVSLSVGHDMETALTPQFNMDWMIVQVEKCGNADSLTRKAIS